MSSSFRCSMCCVGVATYQNWLEHLSTEEHQLRMHQSLDDNLSDLMHPDLRDKFIVVGGILTEIPLVDVASYFSQWGIIKNVIYKGTEDYYDREPTMQCILLYGTQDGAEKAIQSDETYLWGKKLRVEKIFNPFNEFQNDEGIRMDFQPTASESSESVVQIDFSEFKRKKENSLFENVNEYQKIAIQMKDDLSDLKLEEQVDSFCQLLCLTPEQVHKRVELGSQLLLILQQSFPDCAIYPFGLDYIGIACDIDTMNLVVDPFGKMAKESDVGFYNIYPASQSSMVAEILKLLKQEQYKLQFCCDVEMKQLPWAYNDSTKIQKISFLHRDSRVLCNLVIENFIIVQECRLLKFISSLDPRVHSLLCFVRFFGSVYDIIQSSDEAFKNQSLIWLLIFFLSSKKIIPTINELHCSSGSSLIVENIDISFCSDKNIVKPSNIPFMDDLSIRSFSMLSLLLEFFNFFASVNLRRSVICPVLGKTVPVKVFEKKIGKNFPEEIRSRYSCNVDGSARDRKFYIGSPMGLQNPLDLTTNHCKNMTLQEVRRFQNMCSCAAVKLGEILESGSGNISLLYVDLLPKERRIVKECETDVEMDPNETSEEDSEDESMVEVVETSPEPPEEESSWEIDTEEENNNDDDESFQEIKKGKVRVSQSLRKYFEKAISSISIPVEELPELDIRKKFQALWLQYVIEFNSRFWVECFGFTCEAYGHQNVSPEDYSKTDESSSSITKSPLTLKERLNAIKTDNETFNLEFRCETDESISDLLYKKKVWKKNYLLSQMRPLWEILTGNNNATSKTPNCDLQSAKKMVKYPFNRKIEFSCKLDILFDLRGEEEIPVTRNIDTFVKVLLNDESYGIKGKAMRAKKLRFLTSIYEKLAMKYCNLRIKQWLATCKDLNYSEFNTSYKKEVKKKTKGHPKWRKFRRKWHLLGKC